MIARRGFAACTFLALTACGAPSQAVAPSGRFIDIAFPVEAKIAAVVSYPHTVDGAGALWYIDGSDVVRQSDPTRRNTLRLADARSGNIFWYDNAVYVIHGDGRAFSKIDRKLRIVSVPVPPTFAPVEGVSADAARRAIVLAQTSPHELAVVDVWRWYREPLARGIDPFAAALAGGPHGKRFLVVGDRRGALVSIKNRQTHASTMVQLPDNVCFEGSSEALRPAVDVKGRDSYRTWATSGMHVLSIDLRRKKILRAWDLDACAMHLVSADGNRAIVMASVPEGAGYVSSLIRVDRDGVHPLAQYGRIASLGPSALIDRFGRLWWFDADKRAFISRTPLEVRTPSSQRIHQKR